MCRNAVIQGRKSNGVCAEEEDEEENASDQSNEDEDNSEDEDNEDDDDDGDDDDDDSGDDSDDSVERVEEEMLDVNFEFFDPVENDFHSIKQLFKHYLDDTEYNISELADLIIQSPVGSVVKVKENEEVYGVATVLNLQQHKVHTRTHTAHKRTHTRAHKHGVAVHENDENTQDNLLLTDVMENFSSLLILSHPFLHTLFFVRLLVHVHLHNSPNTCTPTDSHSLVPYTHTIFQNLSCMKDITKYLLSKVSSNAEKKKVLQDLLQDQKKPAALLLNER